jgi:RHS repeat-associated protein
MTLDEIGLKFGTDKSSIYHNYLSFYERFFERYRDEPIKLLEIGVAGGASLAMWNEYFPQALIVGADIDPELSVTQTFDANGNLLVQQSGSAFTTYTWDGENRLSSIAVSPSTAFPAGAIVTNIYDGNGLRQGYQDSTGLTTLTYDGQNIYRRDVQSIGSVERYTNEPGDYSPLIGQADTRAGVTTQIYAVSDLSGNVRNWWSAGTAGNLDPYAYEAYGLEWITPAPEPPLSYSVPFFYEGDVGYYQDPTTGLYYVKARWYDPVTGRFISEDPIWPEGGINQFVIVLNNPVRWSDPTGLKFWCCKANCPFDGTRPPPCVGTLTTYACATSSVLAKDEAALIASLLNKIRNLCLGARCTLKHCGFECKSVSRVKDPKRSKILITVAIAAALILLGIVALPEEVLVGAFLVVVDGLVEIWSAAGLAIARLGITLEALRQLLRNIGDQLPDPN